MARNSAFKLATEFKNSDQISRGYSVGAWSPIILRFTQGKVLSPTQE